MKQTAMTWTVQGVREAIAERPERCAAIVEEAIERAADPAGVGPLTYLKLNADEARRLAQRPDLHGALAGLPISIKDLFDVAGEVTTAGSVVLQHSPAATRDADAVARLRAAGAIFTGRTNMTEFAFSGLGLNPHYGTPPSPFDTLHRRIPGGSSSGAAVSVVEKTAVAALGSDTGGSVRIPAALCGITGFKPTQRRISRTGVFPLSPTLDSVGVLAPTVTCCHAVDAVLSAQPAPALHARPIAEATFAVPVHYFAEDLDSTVAAAFERALSRLAALGARLVPLRIPEIAAMLSINAAGGLAAAECYRLHNALGLDTARYDPRVWQRIRRGSAINDADYAAMVEERASLVAALSRAEFYDGILAPTVPIIAPPIAALDELAEYYRINGLLLRNTSFANFFDLCSITMPCHLPSEPPVGLMLTGAHNADASLLETALAIEAALPSRPSTTDISSVG